LRREVLDACLKAADLAPGKHALFLQLDDAGQLTNPLPDLELKVIDADCYDLQRGIVFKERSAEDVIL
jgi:hypothetical protein